WYWTAPVRHYILAGPLSHIFTILRRDNGWTSTCSTSTSACMHTERMSCEISPNSRCRPWKRLSHSNSFDGWSMDIGSRSLKQIQRACALRHRTMYNAPSNTSVSIHDGTLYTDLRHQPQGCHFTSHHVPLPGDTSRTRRTGRHHGTASTSARLCLFCTL